MSDAHGVARDQLRAFIERIERLEEEKKTIADDIKDVYGEAKGMGFIPKMMKAVIALRKKDEMERMEEEAILDTYLHALGMISQPDFFEDYDGKSGKAETKSPAMALQSPRKAAEAVSERTALQVEGETSAEATVEGQPSVTVALTVQHDGVNVGGPEMAGVTVVGTESGTVDNFETCERCQGNGEIVTDWDRYMHPHEGDAGDEAVTQCPDCGGEGIIDRSLSRSELMDVIIASSAEELFPSAPASQGEAEAPSVDSETKPSIFGGEDSPGANAGGDHVATQVNRAATKPAGSLIQSDPAIIFETCPRMPMKAMPYAHCFPELTKTAYQCLAGDIALNGVIEPIVRMGDVIVDGWNRYNAARSLGIEYPVKQYSGDDVLLDVIAWQRSARDWMPQQERKIAAALAKAVPNRADDIAAAFHLVDEEEFA